MSKRKASEQEPDDELPTLRTMGSPTSFGSDDDLTRRAKGLPDCKGCNGFSALGSRLEEFLNRLPKTDLHVHLDGSPRITSLIEIAKANNIELPSYTEEGLRELVYKNEYNDLTDYLSGFQYITRVMQAPGALERISYEFAMDCIDEGIRYVEPRFAPQLLATEDLDIIGVLKAVNSGLNRAKKEYNASDPVKHGVEPSFHYGIICCAMRMFLSDFSHYYKDFCAIHKDEPPSRHYQLASIALVHAAISAKEDHQLPIVGLDIAGAEAGYPAAEHAQTFAIAHKNWLGKTVHAGEAWGPESIFQAITDLHCERIGHGYHIFSTHKIQTKEGRDPEHFVAGLVEYVAKSRIVLEVCLTSNRQTMPDLRDDLSQHALKKMLAHGMCVSICTDNRLVSNTTVCKELALAISLFHITPTELKTIILEGFKRSFFPGTYLQKRQYIRRVIRYYEMIERDVGLEDWYVSEAIKKKEGIAGGGGGGEAAAVAMNGEGGAESPSFIGYSRHHHLEIPPEVFL